MSVAAALTKVNPLTAEECTNRIFVRLDKDNNGEEALKHGVVISLLYFKSWLCLQTLYYSIYIGLG